ncbi:MAG: CHAT domain-containing protein [Coleofasciculus sp. B1-GNL1-01]|uniref:CHAT domain-containing protein n=1 Tax=Coleofasciculus sp. B1-GNL1-01 TaxID=3068484 RepID=UPI0032FD3D9A
MTFLPRIRLKMALRRSRTPKIAIIPSRLKAIGRCIGLGLLTLFLVMWVFPTQAQHPPIPLTGSTQAQFLSREQGTPRLRSVYHREQGTGNRKQRDLNSIQENDNALTQLEQGKALYAAGRFWQAITVWQQAMQAYQAQGDRIHHALSLSYLSLAYQELGQWQEAEQTITQSLNLVANLLKPTPNHQRLLAQLLNTQASLHYAQGQMEAALETWKQAEQAYQDAGDQTGVFGSQINQAQVLQALGLYRRSQITLERVQTQLQTQPDSLLKAAGLRSLGVALQVVGNLEESQQVLQQSLAITQRLDAVAEQSATLFSLGNTARALQEFEEAIAYYQQAASTATTTLTQVEAQLNQLSLLIETQNWTDAQALVPQVQAELSSLPLSRAAVYAQVNFAESLIKMGSNVETLHATSLSRAVGVGLRDNNVTHTQDAAKLTKAALPREQGRMSQSLIPNPGGAKAQLQAQRRAIAQLLARAIHQARQLNDTRAESYALGQLGHLYMETQQWLEARELTEKALTLAQGIQATEIAYRWQWQLSQILQHQGNLTGAIAANREAVHSLQSLRRDLVAINPDVQFSFRETVEPIYRNLVELLLSNQPTPEQLTQARETIESLRLAELENFFREACWQVQRQAIDQIDPQASVIYPIILPDHFAVIVSLPRKPLRYFQTDVTQTQIDSTIEQLLQALNPVWSNKERLRLSQQLYDWLIRPIEPALKENEIKTLVFVLDDALRNLPMAALYDGQQYLIENYNIALSVGLQLIEPRSLLPQQMKALTAGLTEARDGFPALPAVELEVENIAAQIPTKVFLNQQFTHQTLQEQIEATPFPVVHLATHGQFSSKAENTFLLTWNSRIKVKDLDQLLQTRQRQNTNPIELLVLSACQTATGDKRAALGLAGLAVRSGARSTLATLWSVNDESTAQLMVEFYRQLTQSQVSKAQALRQAQLTLLRQPNYQHPFYWAPFVLVGNWL